jgi:AcrR family transcriptional regulator
LIPEIGQEGVRVDRLSRAETQQRTRARVLAAARDEFTERGYRDAKIDVIAERAGLTRGGVYSNFPGKRALYFAVLAASSPEEVHGKPGRTAREALGIFARTWLGRLPMMTDAQHSAGRLGVDLIPEILSDEHTRTPYTSLMQLDALLLGLALEQLHPAAGRRVGVAETVLTTLHGAAQLAAATRGFVDEFRVASACEHLAGLELEEDWDPPWADLVPKPRPVSLAWTPPSTVDIVRDEPLNLGRDGVVAILGLHRLQAIEEAVRAAPAVTAVLVTGSPNELAHLARLVITETLACLRPAFPKTAWPNLRIVHDPAGAVAAAAGVSAVSDATEVALQVHGGRIVARAEGWGACHAVASA